MVILIVGFVGVAAFVAGILFIARGYVITPDADAVVPRSELNALKESLVSAQNEERKTRQELQAHSTQIAELQKNIDSSKKLEENLRAELNQARQQLEELRQENDQQVLSAIQELDRYKNENAAITQKAVAQAEGAVKIIENLEAQAGTAAERDVYNTQRIQKLEAEIARIKDVTSKHEGAVSDMSQEVHGLRAERDTLKKECDSSLMRVQELEKSLAATSKKKDAELESVSSQAQEFTSKNAALEQEREKNRTTITTLEKALADANQQIQVERDSNAGVRSEASDEIQALKDEREENNAKIRELKGQLAGLKAMLDQQAETARVEMTALRAENEAMRAQKDDARAQLEHLQNEVERAGGEHAEKLEEAHRSVAVLQEKFDAANAIKEKVEEELACLKSLHEQLSEKERLVSFDLAKSRAQVSGLEKMCADFKAKMDDLERRQPPQSVSEMPAPPPQVEPPADSPNAAGEAGESGASA